MQTEDSLFRFDEGCASFGNALFRFDEQTFEPSSWFYTIPDEVKLTKSAVALKWYQQLWEYVKNYFKSGPIYDT